MEGNALARISNWGTRLAAVFEIGHSLRAARERQGIGLPEAELATKIRAKYIRALEEEDFDALPADTYARGFLRTYADYLGLDGEIYVDEYASRFHNEEWEDEPRSARSKPRRPRRERTIERRAVVLVLAGIAVLTALVFVAWKFGNAPADVPGARQAVRAAARSDAPRAREGDVRHRSSRREDRANPLQGQAHGRPRGAVLGQALLRRPPAGRRVSASRTRLA